MSGITVLVVGPTPPPHHGGSVATENLLESAGSTLRLVHLDTSDRRDLANVGRFDWTNVRLAWTHWREFRRLLGERRPDVVYVPIAQNRLGFLRDSLFLISARRAGTPVVVHVHGGYFGRFVDSVGPLFRRLIRWAMGGVARVVVLGETLTSMVDGLVPAERVAVVPNGVKDQKRRRTRNNDRLRVTFLGTLTRTKGFLDLMRAARIVLSRREDVEFVLAGDFHTPADREAGESAADALEGHVSFAGVVTGEDKAELLSNSDIFAFPTFYEPEGHPLVVLEAMSARLPIVCTDQGALRETVEDGGNAIVVEQRDVDAIAGAIDRLVQDDALRDRLGRRSRDLYEARYTLGAWVRAMEEVFTAAARSQDGKLQREAHSTVSGGEHRG